MTNNHLSANKRVFGLDFMRATAISLVLSSHCLWIYPENSGIFSQILPLFGFLGVEIFFVLSGFLIGKILYQLIVFDEDFTFSKVFFFLKRRWFRTLPNYFFVLLINVGIAFLFSYSVESIWKYFFFIQNFSSPMLVFFPESWSLSIEEFAYLLFPIILFFILKFLNPKNKSNIFLISTIGLIFFFVFTKIYYYLTTTNTTLIQWNVSLKAVVVYRLDSIFIGILFSWLYYNCNFIWKKYKFLFAFFGVFLMVLMFVCVGFFRFLIDSQPFFWNVLYLPFTSISIAFFLPFLSELKKNNISFLQKSITFISKISYSIYLIHYSIVLQIMKYYVETINYTKLQLHVFTFSYLIITVLLSWFLFQFYEKPIMNRRDKIQNM